MMVKWLSLVLAFVAFNDERNHRMWQRNQNKES